MAVAVQGQTKDESIKWLLSKLNAYGYRPVEKVSEGVTLTPVTEWSFKKGALEITVKKVDKKLNVVKYEYSIPLYAIDSVDYDVGSDGATRPAHYLRMYLSCKCGAYKYHEMVSGGGLLDEHNGKTDRMDTFMLGNEEKELKDRMNKAFAYLRLYFPKPRETF
jgi:hypothetical protein